MVKVLEASMRYAEQGMIEKRTDAVLVSWMQEP